MAKSDNAYITYSEAVNLIGSYVPLNANNQGEVDLNTTNSTQVRTEFRWRNAPWGHFDASSYSNWAYAELFEMKYDDYRSVQIISKQMTESWGQTDTIYVRFSHASNGNRVFTSWYEILHSGNYTNYISGGGGGGGGDYLPLTGGTVTGLVNINTASSAGILTLKRTGNGGAYVDYLANNQTTNKWRVGGGSDYRFTWEYTGDEVAWLKTNGTLLVNKISIGNGNEINTYSSNGTESGYDNLWLNYRTQGAVMLAYGGGNVGIGTINAAAYKLDVAGDIRSTGDQIISSDETLKTNLQPLSYTVDDIAGAPAVSFDWKDGHGHSFGSIAQYWKDICPEMVRGEEGSYTLSYAQGAFTNSVIIAKDVVALKEENKRLKEEISEIKEMLAKLLEKK